MIDELSTLDAVLEGTSVRSHMSNQKQQKKTVKNFKPKAALVILDDETTELPEGAETMSVDEVTSDWVKENMPQVAEELIAEGAEMSEASESRSPDEGGQSEEPAPQENTSQALREIDRILSVKTHNDEEAKLQRQSVKARYSEARFLTELMSLRTQKYRFYDQRLRKG